jgi:serine/threonine protein phosphatase 1
MTDLPAFPDAPRIPPGMTVTAIGDVHGHLDLLEPYLAEAEARAVRHPHRRHRVILLGDVIDRGPRSADTVERLCRGLGHCELTVLRGNHEEAMLDFITGEPNGRHWLEFGGRDTIRSYGVTVPTGGRIDANDLREALIGALPRPHLKFLESLPVSVTLGDYFFVHAGARPGRALGQQTLRDLLWIREEFLASTARFEKKIVHGHTPVPEPDFRDNRINLDTGAYGSGRLTAAVFEDDQVALL